jgi:hypothetical protein
MTLRLLLVAFAACAASVSAQTIIATKLGVGVSAVESVSQAQVGMTLNDNTQGHALYASQNYTNSGATNPNAITSVFGKTWILGSGKTTGASGVRGDFITSSTNHDTIGEGVLGHVQVIGMGAWFKLVAGHRTSIDLILDQEVPGNVVAFYIPQVDVDRYAGSNGKLTGKIYGIKINDLFVGRSDTKVEENIFGISYAGTGGTTGIQLIAAGVAADGVQKNSPLMKLGGIGFATTLNEGRLTEWFFQNRPVQGAAMPSTKLAVGHQINLGALVTDLTLDSLGGATLHNGTLEVSTGGVRAGKIADPDAPPANQGVVFFRDNGSGKLQLAVRFPSGDVQVIKTEL